MNLKSLYKRKILLSTCALILMIAYVHASYVGHSVNSVNSLYCTKSANVGFALCNTTTTVFTEVVHGCVESVGGIYSYWLSPGYYDWNIFGSGISVLYRYIKGTDLSPQPCEPYSTTTCTNRSFLVTPSTIATYPTGAICSYLALATKFSPTFLAPTEISSSTCTLDVTLAHNQTHITAVFPSTSNVWVSIVKGSYSNFSMANSTSFIFAYPSWLQAVGANVYVNFYIGMCLAHSESWWEPGVSICDIYANFICCDRDKIICTALYSQYWWGLFLMIIILLCFWFVPVTLTATIYTIGLLLVPAIWLGKKCVHCTYRCKRRQSAAKRTFNRSMLLIMLCPMTLACDRTMVIATTLTNCVSTERPGQSTLMTCDTTFSAQATIPYLSGVTCLTLLDSSQNVWGQVNITFVSSLDTTTLKRLYYTGSWDSISESHKRCYGAGTCYGTTCALTNVSNANAGGELTNTIVTSWPGQTRCQSSCGCASCGCFYCRDGCLFSRIAIIPHNTSTYEVLQPVSTSSVPTVQVSYSTVADNSVVNTYIGSMTGGSATFGDLFMSIQGNMVGTVSQFSNNYVIHDLQYGRAYYGAASSQNSPEANKVGDLQASSPTYMVTPNTKAFIFDYSAIVANAQQSIVVYQAPKPGINKALSMPQFPMVLASHMLSYKDLSLYGNNTSPGALVVNIEVPHAITMQRYITSTCPSMQLINASGCYGCGVPALVCITAKSTCGTGTAYVTTNSDTCRASQNSVVLTTQNADICLPVLISVKYPDFSLIINTVPVHVSFTATEFINLDQDYTTTEQASTEVVADGKPLDYFSKWFDGWPSWLTISLDILFPIVIIILLILAIVIVVKIGLRIHKSRTERKWGRKMK